MYGGTCLSSGYSVTTGGGAYRRSPQRALRGCGNLEAQRNCHGDAEVVYECENEMMPNSSSTSMSIKGRERA